MQKEPKERLQDAKSVYNALHNQKDHQLLGADKAIQGVKDWTHRHQTSLVLVYGHQGMGTKACFKHLIKHYQNWDGKFIWGMMHRQSHALNLDISGSLDKVSPLYSASNNGRS